MNDYRRQEASEHFERAVTLERAGRIDEAIAEYRRAVDVDPGFSEAHEALGYHYQRRRLLRKSLEAFQAVARLEGHYGAYFNLGYVLTEMERYEEALEAFHHCLTLVPDDSAALYESGYAYYALGRPDEALEALRLPQEEYSQDWRMHSLIGACYLSLGNWQAAEESYSRALEQVPCEGTEEAQAGLHIARRYQEFVPDDSFDLKDQMYTDAGAALLGSAGDNGLQVPQRSNPSLTVEAIAVTLPRMQRLIAALDLDLTAVVAVDRTSIPLAIAAGRLLSVPRKKLSTLKPDDRPLLVLAIGRQPELLQVALEQAPPGTRSFVLALEWYDEHLLLPDFVGIPVQGRCTLPWPEQVRDEAKLRLAVRTLLAACQRSAAEPNSADQVRYYVEQHRRLRFLPAE